MGTKGLTVFVIMVAMCALVASASAPPAPFMIYGYVSYEDGSECDNPTVNINNTNTSNEWSTEIKTNASYNYYQLILANGSDVNANEILRFNVTSPTGNQSNITKHTVIQENITDGGLFNFNITLEALIHDINVSTDYLGAVNGIKIIKDGTAISADQNLTIGEEYQIISRIVNDGDFNETVNVTIKVTNATGIAVFEEKFQKTVNVSDHKDAYRTWDTSGLSPGNYNITVNASIPVDNNWSNNERTRQVMLVLPDAPTITDWYNNKTLNNSTAIAINESECVYFNATADQPIDVWSWFVNGTNQSHNFDNFSFCGWMVNGTYYVKVNGTNANGTSDTINWTVTVNDITPPAKVQNLTNSTPTTTIVDLWWDANTEPDLVGYHVYQNGSLLGSVLKSLTYYNVTGLSASTTYEFNVSAYDGNGLEGENATVTVTTASYPTPAITDWYNNKTEDNTTAITINESECVFFNATANQTIEVWSWFVNGTNQSHNFDNFSYCGWTVNGTYYVEVNGTNANGTSDTINWTVTVNDITPPAKVQNLTNSTPTTTIVDLWWVANTEPDLVGYKVYQNGSLIGTTAGTYYNVTGLSPGTTYEFNVSAYDDNGLEGENATVTVTTVAYPAPAITDWYNNKTKDNSTAIAINESECVFFNATANQTVDVWNWFVNGTNQSQNFDNFSYCNWTVNGTYYVKVNGTNANGTSNTINWTVTVNDTTPPAKVTGLKNDTPTANTVNLTWNASTAPDFTKYSVYKDGVLLDNTTSTYYNVTGLNASTTYYFSISAWDDNNNEGERSDGVTIATAAYPTPAITDWYNNITKNNATEITINESECVFFNATADQPIDVWSWFVDGTNQSHNFDNFSYCGWAVHGTYYVEANATNANGTSDTINWTVTVNPTNTPPWWGIIPNQTIDEDTNLTLNLSGYVHDNETAAENLTLNIVQWDLTNFSQCEINETQYLIAQPKPNWFGLSSGFLVNATDEGLLSNESNVFYVDVTPVNDAPYIAHIPNQTHRVCDSWNVTINVTDVDTEITKDTVTTNDPGNVTVYNATTLTLNYTEIVTNKPVTVTVNDSQVDDSTTFYVTTYVVSPPTITDWYNNKTKDNSTAITINESECVLFNATADQTIDVWSWFVNGTNQSHNFDNFTYCDWTVNGTYYVVVNGTNANGTSNTTTWTVTVEDITPPAKVQNLTNSTPTTTTVDLWWTANTEPDLVGYHVYKNGALLNTTTNTWYNVTGLSPSTTYEFNVSAYDVNGLEGENATVTVTTAAYPAPVITDWHNNKTEDNATAIAINESECVFFNATANQPIDVWSWFVNGTNQSHNFDNFTYCGWAINGTYYVVVNAANTNGTSNTITWTITVDDITPPASVSNLHNITYAQTYISWTWDDPADPDFSHVMVYIDGGFKANVTKGMQYYNAPGFALDSEHIISTRTVDTSGNVNQPWVNHTARTAPDTTPPEVVDYTPTGTSAPVTTNVTATFSEAVNESTLNNETIKVESSTGIRVEGIITYDSGNFTATFDPSSNLEYSETYNVTITTGVQDLAGNNMSSNVTWNFTTWEPDLVISGQWVNWPENCTICYNITNIGNGTVLAGHNTTLYVDGNETAHDEVPVNLAPNESYTGCFNYNWTYTPPEGNITVCADNNKTVTEINESNNCLPRIYNCGDASGDGYINMFDVGVLWQDAYRTPTNGWAEDVDSNGYVTIRDMSLLWQAYKRGGASWEPINCYCTEMGG